MKNKKILKQCNKNELFNFFPTNLRNKINNIKNSELVLFKKQYFYILQTQEKFRFLIDNNNMNCVSIFETMNLFNLQSLILNLSFSENIKESFFIKKTLYIFPNITSLSLNLKGTTSLDNEMINLMKFLHVYKKLNVLIIVIEGNNFKSNTLLKLTDTIGNLVKLKSLHMRTNSNLSSQERNFIYKHLSNLNQLKNLRLAFLNENTACPLNDFSQIIKNNLDLRELSLESKCNYRLNSIQDFCNSFIKLSSLKKLKFSINSFNLTECDSFFECIKGLEQLDLDLFRNRSINNLYSFYNSLQEMKNLIHLNLKLSFTYINIYGSNLLAFAFEKLHNLNDLALYIDNNDIGSTELKQISMGFKTMKNLKSFMIDLSNNNICHLGILSLTDCLKDIKDLTKLSINLNYNKIGHDGAKCLGIFLSEKVDLKEIVLQLSLCDFGKNGVEFLTFGFKNLINLIEINLDMRFNNLCFNVYGNNVATKNT